MGIVDELNPANAWAEGEEENRLLEREETGRTRILFTVPHPKARISVGYPHESFGYPGISMQAEHYFFLDVKGRGRMQFGKPVTFTAQNWFQYSRGEMALSGGKNVIHAARNMFLVFAGGGYGSAAISEKGEMLPDADWNVTDTNEILDAAHWGMRAFDEARPVRLRAHEERLGYAGPPAVALAAAAKKGLLAKLQALLTPTPPPPTASSIGIGRLMAFKGVLNLLEKVTRTLETVAKVVSTPETLPFAGKVFQKIDAVKSANDALRELATARQLGPAANRLGNWDRNAHPFDALSAWLGTFGDFARRIARLKTAAKELVFAVADLVGFDLSDPKVLGLVGRDGVSVVTHQDVFTWAPGGIRFFSAPNATDYPVDPATALLRKARRAEDALANKVSGAVKKLFGIEGLAPSPQDPSFRVTMDADIEMRAQNNVVVAAEGATGTLRAEAAHAVEIASAGVIGLTSRHGAVEVMGQSVSVGVPKADDAKSAAKKKMVLAAAEEARDRLRAEHRALAKKAKDTERRRDEKLEEWLLAKARLEVSERYDRFLASEVERAEVAKLYAELVALTTTVEAEKLAVAAAQAPLSEAATALAVARLHAGAAMTKSEVAETMHWRAQDQELTQTIGVHARDEMTIYAGKSVSIETNKSLTLSAEALPPSVDRATIKVESEIELRVGDFKVTVGKTKITVSNAAGEVIVVDANGATMKSAQAAQVSAKNTEVKVDAPANVEIKAKGRVLLG